MNLAILVGTVTSEARRIDLPRGGTVTKFRLKTIETVRTGGEVRERSQTHLIDVWNPHLQEHITPFLKEGQMVEVQGSIESRNVEKDQSAPARWTTTIVVRHSGTINIYGTPDGQSMNHQDATEDNTGETPDNDRPPQLVPALADHELDDDIPF